MEILFVILVALTALIGLGNAIMIMWLLFGLFMFLMDPSNPWAFFLGVLMPIMIMWDTRGVRN